MQYYIAERKWKAIYLFISTIKGLHTKNFDKLRRFIEVIWYIARTGCQWRLLPTQYGSWRAIHRRFNRWCNLGIIRDMMKFFSSPDHEYTLIDSTIVRSHACAAGYKKNSQKSQALGRSKVCFTTKIHVAA